MLPIELTLHDISRWQPLSRWMYDRCAAVGSPLGEPCRWQVVVERRRADEFIARVRIDGYRGSQHAHGCAARPKDAFEAALRMLHTTLRKRENGTCLPDHPQDALGAGGHAA